MYYAFLLITIGRKKYYKDDHTVFGHMVLIATRQILNMREVLEHHLGSLPWSLANYDGTLKKTNKAVLTRKLEGNVASAEHITHSSAHIIDGMSIVHTLNGENLTSEEFFFELLNRFLQIKENSKRGDAVFDVYTDVSIEASERTLWGSDRGLHHKYHASTKDLAMATLFVMWRE